MNKIAIAQATVALINATTTNLSRSYRDALSLAASSHDAPALSAAALAYAAAIEAHLNAPSEAASEATSDALDDAAYDLDAAAADLERAEVEAAAHALASYAEATFGHANDAPDAHTDDALDALAVLSAAGAELRIGDDLHGDCDVDAPTTRALDRAAAWIADGVWTMGGRSRAAIRATLTVRYRAQDVAAACWSATVRCAQPA